MCDYKSSVCQAALYDSDAAAKMRLLLLFSDRKFAPSDLKCWGELTLKWFCWQFHTIYSTFPHKQAAWILMTCQTFSNTLWIRSEVTWMHKQEELVWTLIKWPHIAMCMYSMCVFVSSPNRSRQRSNTNGMSKHKCTQEMFNIEFHLKKWNRSPLCIEYSPFLYRYCMLYSTPLFARLRLCLE